MSFLLKTIKESAILTNVFLEGGIVMNTNLTAFTASNLDIGSTSASFQTGYFDNLIVSGSSVGNYIRNQISANFPINYNSTTGNISFKYDPVQFIVNSTNGNLEFDYTDPFSFNSTTGLNLNINNSQLLISTGKLNLNPGYIKNLFTVNSPLSYTNENTVLNLDANY